MWDFWPQEANASKSTRLYKRTCKADVDVFVSQKQSGFLLALDIHKSFPPLVRMHCKYLVRTQCKCLDPLTYSFPMHSFSTLWKQKTVRLKILSSYFSIGFRMVFVNFIVGTGIFAAVSNGSGNSEYLTTKYTRYMNRLLSKHFCLQSCSPKDSVSLLFA